MVATKKFMIYEEKEGKGKFEIWEGVSLDEHNALKDKLDELILSIESYEAMNKGNNWTAIILGRLYAIKERFFDERRTKRF